MHKYGKICTYCAHILHVYLRIYFLYSLVFEQNIIFCAYLMHIEKYENYGKLCQIQGLHWAKICINFIHNFIQNMYEIYINYIHICIYTYIHMYAYVYMYIHIYVYIHIYIIYVCIYVYMYIYNIYIHILLIYF